MAIETVARLRQKIDNKIPLLVDNEIYVYVLRNFNQMRECMLYSREMLKKFQDNKRIGVCTATSIYFDTVLDFAEPDDNYFSFVFFESQK